MISLTAEYALRAAALLARDPGAMLTTQQIAEGAEVPTGYLAKVLQALGRAEIVSSTRGLGGGFRLAGDPHDTTVLEVVQAVDRLPRIKTCPLGKPDHSKKLCPLHQRIDDAAAAVEMAFAETTLAEVVETPRRRKRICDFPVTAVLCAKAAERG